MTSRLALAVVVVAIPAAAAVQAARPVGARAITLDQLCGAQATLVAPAAAMRIAGGAEPAKSLFGPGEAVVINAGSAQGIRAGQQYFVRRLVEDRFAERTAGERPRSVPTAGWIIVVDVQTDSSVATVSEACDRIAEGDYLEPLVLPSPSSAPTMASALARS